jgi:flavin reductase (DIM6/NTAB) family NADH-FMN oxidoreductase RutF
VCLSKDAYPHDVVMRSGVFAISLLGVGQEAISNRFAGFDPSVVDRFDGIDVFTAETGSPLLPGAIAWLDCVVKSTHDTTTHTIFIGEVIFAKVESERRPIVYYNRGYHTLVPVEAATS